MLIAFVLLHLVFSPIVGNGRITLNEVSPNSGPSRFCYRLSILVPDLNRLVLELIAIASSLVLFCELS